MNKQNQLKVQPKDTYLFEKYSLVKSMKRKQFKTKYLQRRKKDSIYRTRHFDCPDIYRRKLQN